MSTGEIVAIVEDRCLDDPIYRYQHPDGADGEVGVGVRGGAGAAAATIHPADPACASGTITLVRGKNNRRRRVRYCIGKTENDAGMVLELGEGGWVQ